MRSAVCRALDTAAHGRIASVCVTKHDLRGDGRGLLVIRRQRVPRRPAVGRLLRLARCADLQPPRGCNEGSPLMKTHTTPLPAAATCAVVGSAIGVPDGVTDDVALGVCVGAPVLVAVAVGLELGVGVDAAGAHAEMKSAMNRKS